MSKHILSISQNNFHPNVPLLKPIEKGEHVGSPSHLYKKRVALFLFQDSGY